MSVPTTPETTHRLVSKTRKLTGWMYRSVPCNILKTTPSGKLKVEVFGDNYWKTGKSRINYIEAFRVIPDDRTIRLVGLGGKEQSDE